MSDWGKIYCSTWWGSPEPQQYDRLVTNDVLQSVPDCGGTPVEPDERWFLNVNITASSNTYVNLTPVLPINMSVKTTINYLMYISSNWLEVTNMDVYSNPTNLIYTRVRSGSYAVSPLRMRWGGTGPNVNFNGLQTQTWVSVNEVHNLVSGELYLTVIDLTNSVTLFDGAVTGFGTTGTVSSINLGIDTALSSNNFQGYIANFKIYDETDTLVNCWRIDDNSTTIANDCGGTDGTLINSGYEWVYTTNPLAGQPL